MMQMTEDAVVEPYLPPEKTNPQEQFRQQRNVSNNTYRPHFKDGHDFGHFLENLLKGANHVITGNIGKYLQAIKAYQKIEQGLPTSYYLPKVHKSYMDSMKDLVLAYTISTKKGRPKGTTKPNKKVDTSKTRTEELNKSRSVKMKAYWQRKKAGLENTQPTNSKTVLVNTLIALHQELNIPMYDREIKALKSLKVKELKAKKAALECLLQLGSQGSPNSMLNLNQVVSMLKQLGLSRFDIAF